MPAHGHPLWIHPLEVGWNQLCPSEAAGRELLGGGVMVEIGGVLAIIGIMLVIVGLVRRRHT